MILGIGTDLVDISRMAKNIAEHGSRMAEKILTEVEFEEYKQSPVPAQYLASRFAAKEAFAKAIGTGFRDGLSLKHIEVRSDPLGKPRMVTYERALELVNLHRSTVIHLSLSHEKEMALAFVLLESLP